MYCKFLMEYIYKKNVSVRLNARTEKSKSILYPNCLSEWNKLELRLRPVPSIAVLKKKLLSIICPPPPPKYVYEVHDPKGLSHLTQLRVGLSKLTCHKFKHDFRDTINPMCPKNDAMVLRIRDTFLTLCPSFDVQRQDLLAGIIKLSRPLLQITNLSNDALLQLLLYGDQDLSYDLNKNALELSLQFTHETGSFD